MEENIAKKPTETPKCAEKSQKKAKMCEKATKTSVKSVGKIAAVKTRSGRKLTPQQEMFCQLYAGDREFFGNGVQSYIEAYGVDKTKPGWYKVAKSGACENLTKPYILERIDEIFEAHGLNDQFVDKQLEKLIIQDADFSAKMKAISEYNKLKSRITDKQKVEIEGKIKVSGLNISFDDYKAKKGENANG